MKQLRFGKQGGVYWCCVYFYCHVFPLSKSKNNFYKCRLTYQAANGECNLLWAIPGEYLEENGHFEFNNDLYFARFKISSNYEVEKDENGNVVKDKNGEPKIKQVLSFGRMIDFWNTRIFGYPTDEYLKGLED